MSGRGAYGLRIDGLPDDESVQAALVDAPADWPAVRLRLVRDAATATPLQAPDPDADVITLGLPPDGRAELDRHAATATLINPAPLEHDWLVHPALAFVASVFSAWLGRSAFHAGSFVVDGGAWGILGGHEAGKSSTLGWLAQAGHPILADDMLVLSGRTAFAGPRSIDLRQTTASLAAFDGVGGEVRGGNRRRLTAAYGCAECPLRGFFVLGWSDQDGGVGVRPVESSSERLGGLIANVHQVGRICGTNVFDLIQLPMFAVTRPKDLSTLPATADAMVQAALGELSLIA
jgi:hypothetical protein